jgi:hypothetical protein
MRIALIAFGVTSLALLAGCQSDEQKIQEARTRGLEKCNNSAAAKQAAPGFDMSRFCTCLIDKTLAGKTVAQMESQDESVTKAEGMRNGAECVAQQTAAAPAPGAAPAADPATQDAAAEAAEEAVDAAE